MNIVKNNLLLIILILVSIPSFTLAMTANDSASFNLYNGKYAYGTNMGYYGSHLTDQNVAELAYNAGARTIRVSLPDWLITGSGVDARKTAFEYYKNLGMTDLTAFLGEPNTNGTDNRETKIFPGAGERAKTFKGLYEPIWLDAGKTQINPANTYASYVYKTVKNYGQYVKFWEIVNEPDFTYGPHGWQDKSADPKSWWDVNPEPEDLTNLKAPIQYYIRELRVAYDVIKTLDPGDYVATGGIGYPSFLDALMRNTDNPVDGSVTTEYPLKAGAYFDVLSFHTYPMYDLHKWDNATGGFIYSRHSDAAVDTHLKYQIEHNTILEKYGYNGSTYPRKQWLVTETDVPQATVGTDWGGIGYSNSYLIKAHVLGQVNGIMQTYKYGMGQNSTSTDSFNKMGLYGDISSSNTTVSNAPKTEQYKAQKTLSDLLYGKKYSSAKTSQLNLPSTIRGAAFEGDDGKYVYVLWAKTTTDSSESASANYTFPFTFTGGRAEWDYSSTGSKPSVSNQIVNVTSSPSFFIETSSSGSGSNSNNNPIYVNPTDRPITPTYTEPYTTPTYIQNYNQIPTPSYTSPVYTNPTSYYQNTNTQTNTNFQANINSGYVLTNRIATTAPILNIRKTAAGKLYARIGYGATGTVVENMYLNKVLWHKVNFDQGVTGWVHSRYVKNIAPLK